MDSLDTPNAPPPHWSQVYRDLKNGSLSLLAPYLRASQGHIDRELAAYLAKLIDGTKSETGWRIKIEKHPNIGSRARGREQQWSHWRKDRQIAQFLVDQRITDKGSYESAIVAASNHFQLSQTTIKAVWRRQKHNSKIYERNRDVLINIREQRRRSK